MGRLTHGAAAAAFTLCLAVASVGPASAVAPVVTKCKKPANLVAGISWVNPVPGYLWQVSTVRWQNCGGAIRTVTFDLRQVSATGGLEDHWKDKAWADIVHKANGKQAHSVSRWVQSQDHNSMSSGGLKLSDFADEPVNMRTCTTRTTGTATGGTEIQPTNQAWYLVARAYNASGRKILEVSTPPVVCGQNS